MNALLGGPVGAAGHLVWTTPGAVVVVCVCAAVVAWFAAWPGARSGRARAAELALWAVALLVACALAAGPVWVEEAGRTEPGRLAVLVDASRSMGILEGGQPRSAEADARVAALRASGTAVDVYHFGDALAVGEPDAYDLPGTDLEGALAALGERVAGERLAGVAVVTDGLDRGLLRRRWSQDPEAIPPELPGPLTVYAVGSDAAVRDVAVRSVEVGGFAFLRNPFRIVAQIEAVGMERTSVPITLERDGAAVQTRDAPLDAAGRGEVVFDITSEEAGRFTYRVRAPVYAGDAVPANNELPVVVRVVRDKIRVLQVTGAPSWDVKFLRRFLKSDPSIDLISFFILRTHDEVRGTYDDDELSLIAFPYETLFERDLGSFDVVIFQNFDFAPYFGAQGDALLQRVADYVRGGGALVMIGGDRSFELGDYGRTPLADVLPVRVGTKPTAPDLAAFPPALTADGARHPITRVVADVRENQAWWAASHPLDGTNVPLGAAPGAAVLLTHPTRRGADGQPLPVLAVSEVAAGRSMALTADSSWRWSLSEAAAGRSNQPYLRFWKNALRWLMRDDTVSRVTVETPRENYSIGDDVRVVVRARDPGFAGLANATVAITVDQGGTQTRFDGQTDAEGELVWATPAAVAGAHRVSVTVTQDAEEVGEAETVYAVTTRDPELDQVSPDVAFLRWWAARSGGRFVASGEDASPLRDPDAGRVVRDRRETPLWRAPGAVALLLLCAGLAWWIRRASGLR